MKIFTDQHSRLILEPTHEERMMLTTAMVSEGIHFHSDEFLNDLFENIVANSELDWVDPSETGDLTSAPMLCIRNSDGEIIGRWAWMGYQIDSLQEHLCNNDRTILDGGWFEENTYKLIVNQSLNLEE